MVRRTSLLIAMTLVSAIVMVVDSPDADAQRILQRLRDRVRGRQVVPQPFPQAQQQSAIQQPNARQSNPQQPRLGRRLLEQLRPQERAAEPQPEPQPTSQRSPQYVPSQTVPGNAGAQAPTNAPGASRSQRVVRPIQNQPSLVPSVESRTPAEQPATGGLGSSILSNPSSQRADGGAIAPSLPSKSRVSLGIRVAQQSTGVRGLKVVSIDPESRVNEAGLQVNDVIVALDGRPIAAVQDIADELNRRTVDDEVGVQIVRGSTSKALMLPLIGKGAPASAVVAKPRVSLPEAGERGPSAAELRELAAPQSLELNASQASEFAGSGSRPPSFEPRAEPLTPTDSAGDPDAAARRNPDLGIEYTDASRSRGTVLTKVIANSPADLAGLRVGDRIVAVQGRLLANGEALERAVQQLPRDGLLPLRIVRNGKLLSLDMELQPAAELSNVASESSASKSILGSLIGGFFGDKSKPKTDERSQEVDGGSSDSGNHDALAFDDDEPVRRVGFESENPGGKADSRLDAPSVQRLAPPAESDAMELLPPTNSIAPNAETEKADDLRRQIRELEEKLKELEGQP